jgi:glycosyltransferase involved in cell wall biosynthesis
LVKSNYSNPIYGRKWARANEVNAEFGATTYLSNHLEDAGGSEPHLDVSIVIPLLNEEENINLLYQSLDRVLKDLNRSAEIIFVDDGSVDQTPLLLNKIQLADERVLVIRLRRNFGQTAAFSAGFDFARGDVIITMDGDLQNDPVDIPNLLSKIEEGYDVVSGWRVKRQDAYLLRRLPSNIANWIISRVTGVRLHDYGCSLKAYRREVVKNLRLYGEMHRFIPALASWMGIQVAEIPVNHHPRKFGQSKYGLGRTVKVMLDLVTVKFLLDYATRPIQIFGFLGLLSFTIGTGVGIYLAVLRIFFNQPLGDRPLLLLAVLLVVLGVQLLTMGLMGEMIIRTYHETQGKPIYMIRDLAGQRYRKVDPEKSRQIG